MGQPLEFWFEFASTYSYPAAMRVEAACKAAGVTLVWRPFLLGPVFAAQGLTESPFSAFPVKGAYMWRDMERICEAAGIGFAKPSTFPRGSLLAARIVQGCGQEPWVGDFIRAVYTANFAEDRDIGDDAVIADILAGIGQDAQAAIARGTSPEAKSALRAATDEAQVRGIFGAPTCLIGDEIFWGHDRLQQAVAWAARS